jgi:hypothetical protein
MSKHIDVLICETREGIINILNNSNLSYGIMSLILSEILNNVNIQMNLELSSLQENGGVEDGDTSIKEGK